MPPTINNFILEWYALTTLFISLGYAAAIGVYIFFWKKTLTFIVPKNFEPKTTITVIIPARNEAQKIADCINAIASSSYPKNLYEIIVVDDFSTDDTVKITNALKIENVRVIELKDYLPSQINTPYKKRAIQIAIGLAKGELIVTTDADAISKTEWLKTIVAYYTLENKKFIAAPVNFFNETNTLQKFQSLDYIGMMGVTAAGVKGNFTHICNGANLAYQKKLFFAVDGFNDIDHVASGDDVLLMQKIAHHTDDNTIGFLKNYDAIVFTEAEATWKNFVQQRRRWASKSSSYNESITLVQLALVYLMSLVILFNFFLIFLFPTHWVLYLPLIMKSVSDFMFQNLLVRYFKRKDLMRYFFQSELIHIFYIVYVGSISQIKKTYAWKGRITK